VIIFQGAGKYQIFREIELNLLLNSILMKKQAKTPGIRKMR